MKIFSSKINTAAADLALLVLRLVSAGAMLTHGYPKLVNLLTVRPIKFADPIGLGEVSSYFLVVFAEFVCSILLILGLLTRFAALVLVINFSVIVFVVQRNAAFSARELAVLFLAIFFALLLTGGGRYSLDKKFFK